MYTDAVLLDKNGRKVVVHTPVRTPEQERKWLEGIDRAIHRAFPGRRLYSYKGVRYKANGSGSLPR